ncbi:MAG TPA: hypothetical protein VGL13_03120 [Polyangiaceae bacterium]
MPTPSVWRRHGRILPALVIAGSMVGCTGHDTSSAGATKDAAAVDAADAAILVDASLADASTDLQSRESATDEASSDDVAVVDESDPSCVPVSGDRRQCRPPLDDSLCPGTWDELGTPPCGLRVYVGPVGDVWVYYVSYADIPPLGGPSNICVYDPTSHALTGAWSVGDYLHWCCQSSLDIYQGNVTDEMIDGSVALATHPLCDDDDAGDGAAADAGAD